MSTFVLQGTSGSLSRRIDYAKELNQEQLDVVLHGDGPCLVLAGAGSGKTRTLTYRVAYLLEQGVDPSAILLLTFTNKAAREMLARVGSLLGTEASRIWGGTFHSISSRILRVFAEHLGYASNFTILDMEDSNDLIKAVMKDLQIDTKARRFPSASVVQDVISYARNAQIPIATVLANKHPHFIPFVGDVEGIARDYQIRKKVANTMDFDDLLSNMVLLLEDPQIGSSMTERFQYVLVDEYQDTNAIQARLVKGFARHHKNLVVVGDDAQSIYAFRAADVKNILSFPKQWPDAKIFKLLTNYRSTPEILEVANQSLTHNKDQFEKELVAVHAAGAKPKIVPCASAAQEAQFIAEQVLALRSDGTALRNIAVLFRSSSHSQQLEFELMKRDIPYEYRGGQKFFERAHIKDIISFLRLSRNPKDEVAWLRILSMQSGIGATTASSLARQLKTASTFDEALAHADSVRLSARARIGWEEFVGIARRMSGAGLLPGVMIRAVASSTYQDYLEREYPNWRERLEDVEQLALFADGYQEIEPFLADIALYDDVVTSRERASALAEEERMVLSTIHQAKGLEWDTVFVIHLADQAFPSRRAMADEGGMEEERRLFYVAVTRAQHRLFLSYPLTMGFDALMFNQPSTFLEELSPRLFERVQVVEAKRTGRIGHGSFGSSTVWKSSGDAEGWEEPSIDVGEPRKTSFLREIDEL